MRVGRRWFIRWCTAAGCALAAISAVGAAPLVIKGAGTSFPANLYAGWIARLNADDPDVYLSYEAVGSGEGIRRFGAGKVDFSATERPLNDADVAGLARGVLQVPATAGMIVVAYNVPGLKADLRLSRAALAGIFAGVIRYWDDPVIIAANPALRLPHRSIAVVTRRDASGTTFAFSSHLRAIGAATGVAASEPSMLVDFPGAAMTAGGNAGVAGRIAISEYALGYVEYSFAKLAGLRAAHIQNKSGTFVRATTESGLAALALAAGDVPADGPQPIVDPEGANAYPIVSYSWLLLQASYDDPRKLAALRHFVGWGLTEGQTMAEPLGFLPLPAPVAARSQAIVRRLR